MEAVEKTSPLLAQMTRQRRYRLLPGAAGSNRKTVIHLHYTAKYMFGSLL